MASKTVYAYIDTDVIIRLLTADDLKKQRASARLFEKVSRGEITLFAPDTVIADCVFVLSSPRLYNLPRLKIRDILTPLVKLPNFKVDNKQAVLTALDLFATNNLDFGDVFLVVSVSQSENKTVYSYDHDYDRFSDIKRIEP